MAEKKVTVTPTGRPVCEEGATYTKGQTFEVSPARAKALGKLVEVTSSPEPASDPDQKPQPEEKQPAEGAEAKGKKK